MNRTAVFASLVIIVAAANATAQTASPYAGQQQRTIKALSDQEIGDLLEGRGMGLARSNDLVNWTKYDGNPLWTNARWPSVVAKADPKHKNTLYFAVTREYDKTILLPGILTVIGLKEIFIAFLIFSCSVWTTPDSSA